jgi:hypothetical protein
MTAEGVVATDGLNRERVVTYLGEVGVAFPGERMRPLVALALGILCRVPEGFTVAELLEEVTQQVGRGYDKRPTIRDEETLIQILSLNTDLFDVAPLDDGDVSARLKPVGAIKRQLRAGDVGAPTVAGTTTDGAGRSVQVLVVPVRAQHSERVVRDVGPAAAERHQAIRTLALAYDRYLVRHKHLTMAHRLRLYDGSELRTDLYDQTDHRLYAVAPHTNRDEVRAAVAQLGDLSRFLSDPRQAVLAPDRPDPDLLAYARHMGAEFVYLNAGGAYIDSGKRMADGVALGAPGYAARAEPGFSTRPERGWR